MDFHCIYTLKSSSASLSAEAVGFAWNMHGLCVLMDSAPEPTGQKMDDEHVEVPKVVLCCTGVKDHLCCVESTACWEFWVAWVWTIVMGIMGWGYIGIG